MRVKLGCQPLTWGNDFETAAREIAEIGFTGIEPPVGQYLDRVGELKTILERNKLECCSTYTGGSFEDEARCAGDIERIVAIAAALPQLGCDRIILSAGGRPEGEVRYEMLERFADGANECARRCYEGYGVKSVIHNHAWTLIESPYEVDTFMELTDPLFVLAGFDTAQLAYGGYDPAAALEKWKERIGYLHIKDNNPALPTAMPVAEKNALRRESFHVFWPLGQGALGDAGLDAVLKVLREIDYQGWITSELDSSDKSPRDAVAENYAWLEKHLSGAERVT